MTTGKTLPLTRRTFVDKVMSLLFHMLSNMLLLLDSRYTVLVVVTLDIVEEKNITPATIICYLTCITGKKKTVV